MKSRNRTNFLVSAGLALLFILYTAAVRYIDVRPIGPQNSSVGFAALNGAVHGFFGVNMTLYKLTDILELIAIVVAAGFAVMGLYQLIRRKSIMRIDSSILVLGGFYAAFVICFILFEICIVNYRPVLIDGMLEASYPSSTTMLVLCVMPTAMMQFHRLIKNAAARVSVNVLCGLFTAFIVIGRLVSGVHWLTDIIGAVLLSGALVMTYYSVNVFADSRSAATAAILDGR